MTTKTAPKAFKWNDENSAVVSELYQVKLEEHEGKASFANDKEFLQSLAAKVGAPSDRSVRQKLAQLGVYVKDATKPAAGTTGSTRMKKMLIASMIADEIVKKDPTVGDAAAEIFGSLEHASRPALLALLAFVQGRPIGNEDLEA